MVGEKVVVGHENVQHCKRRMFTATVCVAKYARNAQHPDRVGIRDHIQIFCHISV